MFPPKAIDRVFERLALAYGRAFGDQFTGMDPERVREQWAIELDSFTDHLDMVAWALTHLPERPPNSIQFRNLCRQAPATPEPKRLEAPPADPQRVQAELAKATPLVDGARARAAHREPVDYRAWAKRIVARVAMGDKTVSRCARLMAEDALGIKP